MGVIDWFKRGVGEMMIARPDEAKALVVWKHPDKTIPMKSQLTVEADGTSFTTLVRIDTPMEAAYYRHGGILHYVVRQLADR